MGEWAGRGEREESISLFEGLTEKYAGTNVKFIYAEGCDLLTDDSSKLLRRSLRSPCGYRIGGYGRGFQLEW